MILFKISAPSNLTLFGEYTMKYGKNGLTAGINLRTTLIFAELPEDIIQLEFSQIGLFLNVKLSEFLMFYHECEKNMKLLHKQVLQYVTCNKHLYKTENQKLILQVFFYLFIYITHVEKLKPRSFCMKLSTELMIDTVFVSLIPATVCFAASFLHWSRLQNDPHIIFNDHDLQTIRSYAIKCEEISCKIELPGVIACTYGSVIQHQTTNHYNSVKWLGEIPSETILLVDSKHTPNQQILMQQLTHLINLHPVATNSIFDSIDFATKMASHVFQRLSANNAADIKVKHLSILLEHHILMTFIDMNQRLLQLLNLSHHYVDKILAIAQKHGMYGKSTDFGNGRYAYIWCKPRTPKKCITLLKENLMAKKFDVTVTSLACYGVKIEYT